MFVKEIVLKSFRNYEAEKTTLCPGRNILIGENAQGKTNFLEAIELVANGYSDRMRRDAELIKNKCSSMDIQLAFHTRDREEFIHVQWQLERAEGGSSDAGAIEKRLTIN